MSTANEGSTVIGKVVKTPSQVRASLKRRGVSIASWADEHQLPRMTVYSILHGRLVGERGNAHRAAVLLGLKDGEV